MRQWTLQWCGLAALSLLLQGCASTPSSLDGGAPTLQRTSAQRQAQALAEGQAREYALWAVPFARVANHVYCKYLAVDDPRKAELEHCEKLPELESTGWQPLYDWRSLLNDEEKATGLEFMAFGRASPGMAAEIVIGFRGTDFKSASDWRSNLRWVTRFLPLSGPDQYEVVHGRARQLVDLALVQARQVFPAAPDFEVFATGHSLGGGLAQLLAYSDVRVKGAVVFDSSPVTGYANLVTDEQVNCSARVLRIYERGEVLSYLRSFLRQFYPLSANLSELSFDFLGGNPIANHSMSAFRNGLEIRARVQDTTAVPTSALVFPGGPDCACYARRQPRQRAADAGRCQRLADAAAQ